MVEAANVKDAFGVLDNSFDGAIIDLKLSVDGYEGNDVIEEIASKYRIPIAVMTGFPRNAITGISLLHVFTRGETGYDEILDLLFNVYDTGLTRIFGGRGHIEDAMDKIFWNNILPGLPSWQSHVAADRENTEKALLRFTASQLFEFLDDDSDFFYPEEMYIIPPLVENIRTGNIVKLKNSTNWYIVLSPACDLVLRDGKPKTDRILTCQIENVSKGVFKKNILERIVKNSHTPYYHYLPKTTLFSGGVINFRNIETFTPSDFQEKFEKPFAQISMVFAKDIIARFSSYYSRQGQPDFESKQILKAL